MRVVFPAWSGEASRIGLAELLQLSDQRVAQGAAQLHQLLGKGIDLGVLGACGFLRLLGHAQADGLQLLGQGVAQGAAQLQKLLREAIELGILRACGFGTLAGQRLLKGGQCLLHLLPTGAGAVAHLPAQFTFHAFQPLHRRLALLLNQKVQLLPLHGLFGSGGRTPQREPDQQHGIESTQHHDRDQQAFVHWVTSMLRIAVRACLGRPCAALIARSPVDSAA